MKGQREKLVYQSSARYLYHVFELLGAYSISITLSAGEAVVAT